MEGSHYDTLVIGAGIGGVCAAARLAADGRRTLLVEQLDRVGGRASTEAVDGFLVNTGACAIEYGGQVQRTAELVGAPFVLRRPTKPAAVRLGRLTINLRPVMGGWATGPARRVMRRSIRRLPKLARRLGVPEDEITTEQWLSSITKNRTVHGVVRNVCAAFLAANADETPAKAFLTFFSGPGAFKDYGFHPEGTIGVPRAIVRGFQECGGELLLSTTVESITVEDGTARGARLAAPDGARDVTFDHVVSNVGPVATVGLTGPDALPDDYVAEVRGLRPCPLITVNFATRRPLRGFDAGLLFAGTDRLVMLVDHSTVCPERSPDGWHLYLAWGLPRPALADFDDDEELRRVLDELHEVVPETRDARIVSTAVLRDAWPAQRALIGSDAPTATPVANLWNVGDGVKAYGDGGMEACAVSAVAVVEAITERSPVPVGGAR